MPWQGGSTRTWRKIRARILTRDQHRCQLRYPGICRTIADSVHHVHGKDAGDNPANLIAACTPCNQHAGDPTRIRGSRTQTAPDPQPISRTRW
jgi:5-methylcytosine-specific restriction endonuclease McrA